MQTTGSLISLAWPQTKVITEGKWYDKPLKLLGFIKNGYYTAGHAALLLVNHQTLEVLYYDFGRYHTPFQKGRVRSKLTDPELTVHTKAVIHHQRILNLQEILSEIQTNKACHGDGDLYAAVLKNINYNKAIQKANTMQSRGTIDYGPFKYKGTNCSRFVCTVAKAANQNIIRHIALNLPYTITPTTKFNIKVANSYPFYYVINNDLPYESKFKKLLPILKISTQAIW
jgi:hypothetical protein